MMERRFTFAAIVLTLGGCGEVATCDPPDGSVSILEPRFVRPADPEPMARAGYFGSWQANTHKVYQACRGLVPEGMVSFDYQFTYSTPLVSANSVIQHIIGTRTLFDQNGQKFGVPGIVDLYEYFPVLPAIDTLGNRRCVFYDDGNVSGAASSTVNFQDDVRFYDKALLGFVPNAPLPGERVSALILGVGGFGLQEMNSINHDLLCPDIEWNFTAWEDVINSPSRVPCHGGGIGSPPNFCLSGSITDNNGWRVHHEWTDP